VEFPSLLGMSKVAKSGYITGNVESLPVNYQNLYNFSMILGNLSQDI
jgi:hypothetical protein